MNREQALTVAAYQLCRALSAYDLSMSQGPRERPPLWRDVFEKGQTVAEIVALANLQECGCCHDEFALSRVIIQDNQVLCIKCAGQPEPIR